MSEVLEIDYTNWRGERRRREIIPKGIHYGLTEQHRSVQWFLIAIDVEKREERYFAMKDIHGFGPFPKIEGFKP